MCLVVTRDRSASRRSDPLVATQPCRWRRGRPARGGTSGEHHGAIHPPQFLAAPGV